MSNEAVEFPSSEQPLAQFLTQLDEHPARCPLVVRTSNRYLGLSQYFICHTREEFERTLECATPYDAITVSECAEIVPQVLLTR